MVEGELPKSAGSVERDGLPPHLLQIVEGEVVAIATRQVLQDVVDAHGSWGMEGCSRMARAEENKKKRPTASVGRTSKASLLLCVVEGRAAAMVGLVVLGRPEVERRVVMCFGQKK